ncbi:MAG TPA: hypothetical protein VN961_23985 [Streptosporangiaceae bacterium]|jgi:hypothetical protein|nr:hypothetical protein [Streptosporangiaceae bacterium]
MGGPPRDRAAERAAITAAAARLLAGTPLRTTSGKLTATELIAESGVRRDILYEHRDLVDDFKAKARLRYHVPEAMQELADRCSTLAKELTAAREELSRERAATALLRRVVAELSIELDQSRAHAEAGAAVTRLDSRRAPATNQDGQ